MRHANNANNVVISYNGDTRFSVYSCQSEHYVLVLVCMGTRRFCVQALLLKINAQYYRTTLITLACVIIYMINTMRYDIDDDGIR